MDNDKDHVRKEKKPGATQRRSRSRRHPRDTDSSDDPDFQVEERPRKTKPSFATQMKKLISKKKTDIKFKTAGPGHKLSGNESDNAKGTAGKSTGHIAGTSGGRGGVLPDPKKAGTVPSEEKRQAAAAALARLEKQRKPTDVNEKDRLAARQLAYIKEQARREIEAEMRLKESGGQGSTPAEEKKSEVDSVTINYEDRDIDPANYAVSGVFYTCPLVGPEVASIAEIEENIKKFLRDQPEEEIAITSCLMIHSCNRPKEKINTCVEILCKYIDNIIQNPDNPKVRKIRLGNKAYQEKVAIVEGANLFLQAAGFERTQVKNDDNGELEEVWMFKPSDSLESDIAHIAELRDTLKQTTPIKPELDRNLQVLMPAQVKQRKELPAEFYQLTVQELKREQQLKTELAERELTLRTKAQREKDELREQRIYRYCVMRIRFPDGFTLQGTFWARDKVSELYKFVRENLVSEDLDFLLRMPRGEYLPSTDATLAESRLPPASIVNFHVENPPAGLASGELSYLKPEILALVKPME